MVRGPLTIRDTDMPKLSFITPANWIVLGTLTTLLIVQLI